MARVGRLLEFVDAGEDASAGPPVGQFFESALDRLVQEAEVGVKCKRHWVRSLAWHWVFSPKLNTTARRAVLDGGRC